MSKKSLSKKTKKTSECGSDCTCGCNEGKECTCDEKCSCGCGCGSDCDCGCQDDKECTCGDKCCCDDCCDCCDCCCDCCDCDDIIVELGDTVPDFEIETWSPKDAAFGNISLEELRKAGKWTVLVFFPAAFSFVCPTELPDVAANYTALSRLGAEVISVSTDTKFVQLAWQQSEKLLAKVSFPMAADPTGELAKLFGVYDENTGLALRGTFIINPDGVLVSSEISYYNVARSAKELLRKLKANIYAAKHPEEVCPANWVAGKNSLKPSEKLVGKVSQHYKA